MKSQALLCIVQVGLLFNHVHSLQPQSPSSTRRNLLKRVLWTGGASVASASFIPDAANAAQGAAEYDLEYYMRDLFQGNPKQGTRAVSSAPPPPPPRVLKGLLLPLLLNDELVSCIPVKVLSNLLPNNQAIEDKIQTIRTAASRSFQSKAPWNEEHVTDQYYFDLTSYALWKTAAELLPDYKMRDTFARTIGRDIYNNSPLFANKATKNNVAPLTSTIATMTEILDLFNSTQYCTSYRIGGDDAAATAVFDELDDDDLANDVAVNCLISIYNPATLGASLQITGEQSRFIPEYVGTTLAAMWESVGIKASYETYFVDPEYRPNPKDYFPNEQLLQFTLTKS